MLEKKFKIYSSSAGSGKTYTLTKEYLKLALKTDNPHYFKNILAITFTNDAANEMKERIVNTLKGFAFSDLLSEKALQNSRDFLKTLSEEMRESEQTLRLRAEKVFAKIIYNYADFSVSTIDKFVNKVTGAFTRELEIPYNYEVDLDTDQLLQNAVDRVIEKVGRETKEHLSDFLVDWVSQKAKEGKNWGRVATELADFANELMNESAYKFINQLRTLSIEDFKDINSQMEEYQENLEKKIQAIARKGQNLIMKKGLEDSFLGGKRASVASYFHKNTEDLDMQFRAKEKAYMNNALNNERWYKEKTNTAIDEIKADLIQYIQEIEEIKDKEGSMYELISLVLPNLYKLALIQEIEQELVEVKKENNSIHISDTNKKIAEIIAAEPVPYIYERVGEKFNHILIDEFQDTSVLQWQNLLPLIENNLAEAHFNLIVGDAKQAIYRWRGGEMEQLVYLYKNHLEDLMAMGGGESPFLAERYEVIEQNHNPQELNYNFRSTKELIDFNNEFFRTLVKSHDFSVKYPLFPLIYDETFEQKIPEQNTKTGGHIEIEFIDKGDTYRETTLARILELIEKAQADGFRLNEIAILTRSNFNGREIAIFLKENKIDIISQESLLLSSDEKVRFLVALLKVIHKPDDKLAKSEAMYLFYKVVRKEIPNPTQNIEIKEVIAKSVAAFYEKISQEGYLINFPKLQALNLYELVEKLVGIFKLLDIQSKPEYIFRFLDVILQFNLQKNTTLADFLEYWEDKKTSLSINTPKDLNAVIVTSIHKSKGLEYPVVILPFADWSFSPRVGAAMWVNLEESGLNFKSSISGRELKTALAQMNQKLENTEVAEQYRSEMEKTFIENVNMLYVAFTRAVNQLYILAKYAEFDRSSNQKSINFLIYLYLKNKDFWKDTQRTYQLHKGMPQIPKENDAIIDEEVVFYIEEFVSTDIHKKIRLKGKKKVASKS